MHIARVSQSMIFDMSIGNMNKALRDYTEASLVSSTQKKINKASDDPAATATILSLRSRERAIAQEQQNLALAEGWLSLADEELRYTSTVLTRLVQLAEEGSTGSVDDGQLDMIAQEVRQLLGELVGAANAEFAGDNVFAGQKTSGRAYEAALGATVLDPTLDAGVVTKVSGAAEHSVLVEFLDSGTLGGAADLSYRYSADGGETWTQGVLAAGETTLDIADGGACRLTLASGTAVSAASGTSDGEAGSRFLVRPSAVYLGDTGDGVDVVSHGAAGIAAEAAGDFAADMLVRIDQDASLPGPIAYSVSSDGGSSWTAGLSSDDASLELPGGVLNLTDAGSSALTAGDSFSVRPHAADITLSIGDGVDITLNNVGKDIFGGLVKDASGNLTAASGVPADENLFETVGELIGYLEIGDQDGVADCLERLSGCQERVLAAAADVGARESRLEYASTALEAELAYVKTHKSRLEDADATQTSVDISRTQYVYQAVLETSVKIMNMSLLDYI